jgi:hypothetical protein
MNKNVLIIILFLTFCNIIFPCTTAVISGKASADGRPMLLKNRDADELQNKLVSFHEGNFKFIGVVNSNDKDNKQVWSGFNNYGFAIMNSASYNLKINDTTKLADLEGVIMKKALGECKTVDDFENLLKNMKKPYGVEANFGVIDAQGGAAYFEVNNFTYVKYDVNDPTIAPNGYLLRTNFSFSGEKNKGFGYIRFNTESALFSNEFVKNKISAPFLFNNVVRCLNHSLTGNNLEEILPANINDTKYVFFRDYIPRLSTASAVVIQGVKKDEPALLTTMWTVLGFPLTSVAVPVWVLDDGSLPAILTADKDGKAPLCDIALKLKSRILSGQTDARDGYINLAVLVNKDGTGIRQKLIPVEMKVINEAAAKIGKWRQAGFNEAEAKSFYNWVDSEVLKDVKQNMEMK